MKIDLINFLIFDALNGGRGCHPLNIKKGAILILISDLITSLQLVGIL